jgi:hypothetical protein
MHKMFIFLIFLILDEFILIPVLGDWREGSIYYSFM